MIVINLYYRDKKEWNNNITDGGARPHKKNKRQKNETRCSVLCLSTVELMMSKRHLLLLASTAVSHVRPSTRLLLLLLLLLFLSIITLRTADFSLSPPEKKNNKVDELRCNELMSTSSTHRKKKKEKEINS
jgi:hypothetical protein